MFSYQGKKLSSISRHELAEKMKLSAESNSASCVLIDGCGFKGAVPEESLDCDSLYLSLITLTCSITSADVVTQRLKTPSCVQPS